MTPLSERLRRQAEHCRLGASELTATLLEGAADDLDAGGPVADLLGPHADDPAGTVPALRLAGALHRLVLERRAPELALHYPTVGGTAPVERAWPAARAAVAEQLDALRPLVARPVQTNEVGRAAALFGALQHLGDVPVRLLEVGASGGLNLRVDAFAYVVDGEVRGDPASPVVLREPWSGPRPPATVLRVVERAGCDPAPVDPTSADGRLTLSSYVWGDHVERFARLGAALQVAARVPATVEPLPASAFLARELAAPRPGVATVVWHSVVRQYLEPEERERVDALLEEAGARATPEAPLHRVSLEPEADRDDFWHFRLVLRSWPGGEERVLAETEGHGPPVVWQPSSEI